MTQSFLQKNVHFFILVQFVSLGIFRSTINLFEFSGVPDF